jgi:uncharacterized spore protein YtfJ
MARMNEELLDPSPATESRRFSVERLAAIIGEAVRAKAVFGDPVERDGVTVIPVAHARWGFGGGGGGGGKGDEGGGGGGGGGGGAVVRPVGYIEIRDGKTEFRPIRDRSADLKALAAGGVLGLMVLRKALKARRSG